MARFVVASVSCLLLVPAAGRGQACAEPHYRWSEKVDTTLQARPATPADIAAILTDWAPLSLTSKDRCAPRVGREDSVFTVVGWVRRLKLHEADGDWHIELTQRLDSPADSCVVVEIPAVRYSPRYARARAALDSLIGDRKIRRGGLLARPVLARISGAPFFDGQHRRGGRRSDKIDGAHGRCNSSVRALWEIHPVYRVTSP